MIKALALDDEPPALEVIKNFCGRTDGLDLQKVFTKTEEATRYLAKFPVDLLFLDINMPSVSGLEFSKKAPPNTMVIFTTAHSEFAVDGFNLNAIDYLLKPFTYERFLQAAEKVKAHYRFLHQNETTRTDYILVRADYAMMKVQFDNILYIEGLDDYSKIHQKEGKPVITRITMKALSLKLPEDEFIRVHRSFIVPFGKIESVRNKFVFVSGKQIPIGTSYEEAFFARLSG